MVTVVVVAPCAQVAAAAAAAKEDVVVDQLVQRGWWVQPVMEEPALASGVSGAKSSVYWPRRVSTTYQVDGRRCESLQGQQGDDVCGEPHVHA